VHDHHLQCIALAASGRDKSNQVAGDLPARLLDRRTPARKCRVEAQLAKADRPEHGHAHSWLEVAAGRTVFIGDSEQTDRYGSPIPPQTPSDMVGEVRSGRVPGWLCVAYGVHRNLPIPLSVEPRSDPAQDRVKSLFDPRHQIIGTDFVGRWEPKRSLYFAKLVKKALVDSGLLPEIADLELRGRGGIEHPSALIESQRFEQRVGAHKLMLPAVSLSQGYQSMIAWVADLIGQALIDAGDDVLTVKIETLQALVLVDEIDLHLHPAWQRVLVRCLKKAFPKVQFVATTHSPLVLAGLDEDEVWILEQDADGSVTARQADDLPRLMTASGLLQRFFGVASVDPEGAGKLLRQYGVLDSLQNRSEREEAQRVQLLRQLADLGVEPPGTRDAGDGRAAP